jgi:DNA-nicking Smr family endonuclease
MFHRFHSPYTTVSEDDPDIFRNAIPDAKPLRSVPRAEPPARKPKPRARFSRADEREALRESLEIDIDTMESSNAERLHFRRPTVGRRTMRQLARGKFAIQDEIDLHGMTIAEARPRLADFIENSVRTGRLCVRVVHGKGLGSGHRGPVLKNKVNHWLRQWESVLAFVSARQVDGGTGAVYVLLQEP